MSAIPPDKMKDLRKMSLEELCTWISGWNDGTGRGWRLLGEHELQRRLRHPDAIRSWTAVGISIASVILSIVFHFLK